MIKTLFIVLLCEIFNTCGNVFFKKSLNDMEFHSFAKPKLYFIFLKNVLLRPLIWLGLIFMALCLIAWIMALSRADLSIIFSVGSIQYVLILLSARFFLNEKIDMMKAIGTISIMIGIALVALK